MRKPMMLAALVAAVVLPNAVHAQAGSKFQLGLRLGYAGAMGDAAKDVSLGDIVKSQIPLQLDALYKVTPEIAVGLYGSYGFAQAGKLPLAGTNLCDLSGVDCSAAIYRLGVEGVYTFTQVKGQFVPWAGLGIGFEWANITAKDASGKLELSYNGMEYFNLQVGGDYKLSPQFSVGPYATFSYGQYGDGEAKFAGQTIASGIDNKAAHQWWSIGVAGKFDL